MMSPHKTQRHHRDRQKIPFGRFWQPAVAAAVLLSLANLAQATEALEKRIAVVAKNVATLMKAQQLDAISIGAFAGPPNFPTSSGPALVQMFTDEFARHQIAVKSRAKVGLTGSYSITEVEQFDSQLSRKVKHLAVKLDGRLVDQFGAVLVNFNTQGLQSQGGIQQGTFQETVSGADTLVETIGLPADLPAESTETELDRKLRESLVSPKVTLDPGGTRYRASPQSPYAIEILVDGQPCPIKLDEDLPYVEIQRGQTYAVKVYNNSDYDAAVRLLVDGLSVFTFSDIRDPQTGKPKYNVYIVGKGDSPTLKGWHKTNSEVASFLVTGYEQSAAAQLGHTQDLGTITVTFAAAWPKNGGLPPPDEFTARSAGSGNATGFGPPIEHVVKEVQMDTGRIRASLSVRYTR